MRRRLILTAALAAGLAGCGNAQTRPPDVVNPDDPKGTKVVDLEAAGVSFTAPFNWTEIAAEGSRAGGIQSKTASVAIWRYPRSEPLPQTDAALEEVKDLLVDRVKARDPSFEVRSARATERAGARAIVLVGSETIGGLPYEVRSTHLFDRGAEVVVDAYAPPRHFARLDESVFEPLVRSLKLKKPRPVEEDDGE